MLKQIATALFASGFPPGELTSMAVLVAPCNAEAALRELRRRKGGQMSYNVGRQADMLRKVAKVWVKDEASERACARYAKSLAIKSTGMTPKNRERLRQFDLASNLKALLTLPGRVLREGEAANTGSRNDAVRVMSALAVELLIVAPLRIKNLTNLEVERHLTKVRRGRETHWHIVVPGPEVKNDQPFQAELSFDTVNLLNAYLSVYRARVRSPAGSFLFCGHYTDARSPVSFSTQIQKFIRRETGLKMNSHLFRHLCAKLYLDRNPHDIETVRRLLGHRSIETTIRFYAEFRTDEAFRRYDSLIEELREADAAASAPRKVSKGGARARKR